VWSRLVLPGCIVCSACAPSAGAGAPAEPPRPAPSVAPLPARSSAAPAAAPEPVLPKATLSPREPRASANVRAEILFPFAEQRILIPKAKGYVVRTKIERAGPRAAGEITWISLDGQRPRELGDKQTPSLSELVDEPEALGPGPHYLTLAVVGDDGLLRNQDASRAAFAAVRFWIGDRDPKRVAAPHVALLSPRGTYNGPERVRSVLIDFLALPMRLGPGGARIQVRGPGTELTQRVTHWQPYRLEGAAAGDWEVVVSLLDEKAEVQGEPARSVVTLNPELDAEGAARP